MIKFSHRIAVPNIILVIILLSRLAYAGLADIPSIFFSLPVKGDPSIVWFEKGKILYEQMAYREAERAFSQMDKNAPQDIMDESLYLRANSLMQIGSYSEAMEVADLIPGRSRFHLFGLYTKAMISLNTGREKDAIDNLKLITQNAPVAQAIKEKDIKDKNSRLLTNLASKAHLTLGFIYLERNNTGEAIKNFSVIPRDNPFYMQALFGMGWAYTNVERWVRSVVFWEELSYLYPESVYTREVTPYIAHIYATLSAYGKAVEQNGVALLYYEDLLKKISDIEKGVQRKDVEVITRTIDFIGDKQLTEEFKLYNGLLSMEEYLSGVVKDRDDSKVKSLTEILREARDGMLNSISKRLTHALAGLRHQLLETAANTTIEMARNLRSEGGGHISDKMVFDEP